MIYNPLITQETEEQQPKRGRKAKPDAEKRSVKISIYLTPEIYNGLKICAAISQQDLSDFFNQLASDCIERNSEAISAYQAFLDKFGGIK